MLSLSVRRHGRRPRLSPLPPLLPSLTGLGLAAALTLPAHVGTPGSVLATADTATQPSTTSAAALYVNNWSNLTAIWNASQLNQDDTGDYGPRIAELRASNQWSTNQIVDYTGFFEDATDNVKYDDAHDFASSAYLDQNG